MKLPLFARWLLLFVLLGCQPETITVRGSGELATMTRAVSAFDQVELAGIGSVIVAPGETGIVTIEAEDNFLDYLTANVYGTRLVLDVRDYVTLQPTLPVTFRVSYAALTRLDISGSGEIHAEGVDEDTLNVDLGGTGNISVVGSAGRLTLDLNGASNYDGRDLLSHDANVTVSGMGSAVVNAADTLNVDISGTGFVSYLGSPAITQEITGVGGVIALE